MQNNSPISQVNAFAMYDGVVLGLFGLLTLYVSKLSFSEPFFSTLFLLMLIGSPVLAAFRTFRFRRIVTEPGAPFTFTRGFLHALFMGFYASIWVALGIFLYFSYLDHGSYFASFGASLARPEIQESFDASGMTETINLMTNGRGVEGLVDDMQAIGAATYAALALYSVLIFGPFISLLIGLLARRG